MDIKLTFGDLFAGGGGVTTGALSLQNVKVLWALNHDPVSIATHAINHPETKHYQSDIRKQNEKELDQVDILWASLECTNYSNAKGGFPRDADSRTLAWEIPRYAEHCKPTAIIIENVREFLAWGELDEHGKPVNRKKGQDFQKWIKYMSKIGYSNIEWKILNAADYGCHTRRERLFIIFTKDNFPIKWKQATHHPDKNNLFGLPQWKPAREIINLENEGESIFGRKKPLVPKTIRRIAGGYIKQSGMPSFIMKYYGTGYNISNINEPLHTIPTKDRHALITIKKEQFISKYYGGNQHHSTCIKQPLPTITTVDHNSFITVKRKQIIADHCWINSYNDVNKPLNTILTWQTKQLLTIKDNFISSQYSSGNKPEANTASLDKPLGSITTNKKHQLITALGSIDTKECKHLVEKMQFASWFFELEYGYVPIAAKQIIEFMALHIIDVLMRFLDKYELGAAMGFPKHYFDKNNHKDSIKMIGNAVPVNLAASVIEPMAYLLKESKIKVA